MAWQFEITTVQFVEEDVFLKGKQYSTIQYRIQYQLNRVLGINMWYMYLHSILYSVQLILNNTIHVLKILLKINYVYHRGIINVG